MSVQSPPNNGTLVAAGALGADPEGPAGFDIYTVVRNGVAVRNSGLASLVVNGLAGVYRIDLLTGKATLIANLDDAVVDIAIPLEQ